MSNEIIGDLVVYGRTYTAEKANEVCEAFVVKDKKFIGQPSLIIRFSDIYFSVSYQCNCDLHVQ